MIMTPAARQALHPFFDAEQRKKKQHEVAFAESHNESREPALEENHGHQHSSSSINEFPKQESKLDEPLPKRRGRPPKSSATNTETSAASDNAHASDIEPDPNVMRRKRRKVTPPFANPWAAASKPTAPVSLETAPDDPTTSSVVPDEDTKCHDIGEHPPTGRHESKDVIVPGACTESLAASEKSQPSKVLKLNGKGGFGSPVKKIENFGSEPAKPKRGRPKKQHAVLILTYGQDDPGRRSDIGAKIDMMLQATSVDPMEKQITQQSEPVKLAAINPNKSTHPFFSGKPKQATKEPNVKANDRPANDGRDILPRKVRSFSTPKKIRPTFTMAPDSPSAAVKRPTNSFEAMWTFTEAVEAERSASGSFSGSRRNLDPSLYNFVPSQRSREKSHLRALSLPLNVQSRDVIGAAATKTEDCPGKVRFVRKSLVTGRQIVDQILPSLRIEQGCHPAVKRLLDSLETRTSAFDEAACEKQQWVQKYSPSRAYDVLQPPVETNTLKRWLESLIINTVQTAFATKAETKHMKRKKKRKTEELDDFIVDDDEDDAEMLELGEETFEVPPDIASDASRSLIRQPGINSKGRSNAVLISGPHGCGKTAAAYAAAKELDYDVFEINPSSRRSGKDIIDKVGDMTSNHQVYKGEAMQPPDQTSGNLPNDLIDDKLPSTAAADQHTLGSFFKASASSDKKVTPVQKKFLNKTDIQKELVKPVRRHQKQSLILIEEADILFADDKQFWETIMELAIGSKRPIIMTCVDESRIPTRDLSLHAVLRFKPVSLSLASDYMLSLAACEGHLLTRTTVMSLYESCNYDLRAAIMELNFWCQMGIGSQVGGLDWYPSRWPVGSDLDESGCRIRTCSNDSLIPGLGWHTSFTHHEESRFTATHQSFTETDYSIAQWLHENASLQFSEKRSSRESLLAFGRIVEAASDIDLSLSNNTPGCMPEDELLDMTSPALTASDLASHTSNFPLLQADLAFEYDERSSKLASAVALLVLQTSNIDLDSTKLPDRRPKPERFLQPPKVHRCLSSLGRPEDDYVSPNTLTSSKLAAEYSPYVRQIAASDLALERFREQLEEALSDGSGRSKRARMTRTARSALEGGIRSLTRKERWLPKKVSLNDIMKTGGTTWPQWSAVDATSSSFAGSEPPTSQDTDK